VDVGIIRIGNGQVMALSTDPLYIVPQYGWEKAAWFAWHILASDVTTSGLDPAYLVIDFNLPMSIQEDELAVLWNVLDQEWRK